MDGEWIKILASHEVFDVEMARQKLEEGGIEAVVMNKQDSSRLTYGEAGLYVRNTDVEEAEKVLQSNTQIEDRTE